MALPFLFTDNARSTLGASLSVGGGTITLAGGGGALFPNPAPGQQFALTLNDLATQTVFETVWCTARAGDVLTVVRAQEGTVAHAWSTGDFCWNGPTAGQMNNMVQTPHMLDGSISPTFGSTTVQATLGVNGPVFGLSTAQFSSTVSATDPSTGTLSGVAIQSTVGQTQGARLKLAGNPGTGGTPNKWLRAQAGIFDIVNSGYTAQILTLSDLGDLGAIRNITASGSASISGSVTSASFGSFIDSGTTNGLFVNGVGGTGANIHLHTATGDKYLRTLNNRFEVINAAYSGALLGIDDAGNMTVSGLGVFTGGVTTPGNVQALGITSGNTVQANNGNVTAFNGHLRASIGARGSGDPSAGVLLGDYFNTGNASSGYNIFPNGMIIQWGQSSVACPNPEPEGGFTWFFGTGNVTFPTTFPNAIMSAWTTPIDIVGHLAINANITALGLGSMSITPHVSISTTMGFFWVALGF